MTQLAPKKILVIQFKYFGDTVFITPALQAIKSHYPQAELHVLIAAEMAPILQGLNMIDRLWPMTRKRGKSNFKEAWPFIKQLRQERFDQVVDFGGNDRGALLSLLSGAPQRLSYKEEKNGLIKRLGYTQTVDINTLDPAYAKTHLQLLSAWGIPMPDSVKLNISDKAKSADSNLIPDNTILCHLGTSEPKKEWPLAHWYTFYQLATKAGYALMFSSGPNERERALLSDFKAMDSNIATLPMTKSLGAFLDALSQASLFISGDTGPLHFAAGLDVPVIGLYAVGNSVRQAAPNYGDDESICAKQCACYRSSELACEPTCGSTPSCMSTITPTEVLSMLQARTI